MTAFPFDKPISVLPTSVRMVTLIDPETWELDKIEVLFGQRFNISGKQLVRKTSWGLVERVGVTEEGTWHYEMETTSGGKLDTQFPTFNNLLEFLDA